jgi:cysteine-rich repeat protein
MTSSNAALVLAALCSVACALPHASAPVVDDDGGAREDIIPLPDRVDPMPDRVDPMPDRVVPLPDVVIECPAGQQRCADGCVDVQTSASHCGGCGRACASGQSCLAGTCADDCPAPRMLCSGSCVDTSTDRAHCGACGRACATGQSCTSGTCVCPANQSTLCPSGCVDLRADNNNCGSCGTRCVGGQSCMDSRCVCPVNTHACTTGCQPDNSTMYCGASCAMCPAPAANGRAVCDAGACRIVCDPMFVQVGNNCERSTTCGDGTLDMGETCDDGNRTGGDGCSPMCALEANTSTISCGATRTAIPIAVNQRIQLRGATSGSGNMYSDCAGNRDNRANGPEAVFQLRLTAAGRLRTTVTPEGRWDIVLKGGVACPGLCIDGFGDEVAETGEIRGALPAGTVFYLIVDGFNSSDSGRFRLDTELLPP